MNYNHLITTIDLCSKRWRQLIGYTLPLILSLHLSQFKLHFYISPSLAVPDSVKPNPSIPSSPILTLNLPVPSASTTSNGKRNPSNALQQQLPPLQQSSPRYVHKEVPPRFRQQEQRQLLKRGQPLPTAALNPTSACSQTGVISPPGTPTSKRHTGENHVLFLMERLRYLF